MIEHTLAPTAMPGAERTRRARSLQVALALALLVALRVYLAFSAPENSDESQHLHVAWSLAQGLVPYRDVFDNHAPLFQFLFAPVVSALGERADIVALMRLAMIPFYGIALWLTWYVGRSLWSSQVGTIAAAITAAAPIFFRNSVEFRPDVPWMACWLGVVAVVVSPLRVRRKGALAGLLAGTAFAISLKTVLLCGCAAAAGLVILHARHGLRDAASAMLAGACAMLAVPLLFALLLWRAGAWNAAAYCLVGHNVVGGLGRWDEIGLTQAVLLGGFGAVLVAVHRLAARDGGDARAPLRLFAISSAALYVLALYGAWPLVTHQDLLPAGPLLAVGVAAAIGIPAPRGAPYIVRAALAAAMAAVCIVNVAATLLESRDDLAYAQARRQRVLDLAPPDAPVMDAKGFAVFRTRPVYWVLESITARRIRDGSIADPIAARLAATSTPIVLADNLPNADRAFVERNYLCVDHAIFVAGQRIAPADRAVRTFEIAVPLRYEVIAAGGVVPAIIDGRRVTGAVDLAAGQHTLSTDQRGSVALVWDRFAQDLRAPTVLAIRDPHSC